MRDKLLKFLLPVLFLGTVCSGQQFEKFVAIDYLNKPKRIKYYTNERITILTRDKITLTGAITNIGDSSFTIDKTPVRLSDVSSVLTYCKGIPSKTGLIAVAGVLFTATDIFYRLIEDKRPVVEARAVIVGTALIAGAGLIGILKRKQYKIKGKRVLRIINTSPI